MGEGRKSRQRKEGRVQRKKDGTDRSRARPAHAACCTNRGKEKFCGYFYCFFSPLSPRAERSRRLPVLPAAEAAVLQDLLVRGLGGGGEPQRQQQQRQRRARHGRGRFGKRAGRDGAAARPR